MAVICRGGGAHNKGTGLYEKGSLALMMVLVKRCAEKLEQHYPNHIWAIAASKDNTVVNIKCLNVSDEYGYVLHTTTVQNDPELKCVVMAGGEILERGAQMRGKWDGFKTDRLDLTGAKQIRKHDLKELQKKIHHTEIIKKVIR